MMQHTVNTLRSLAALVGGAALMTTVILVLSSCAASRPKAKAADLQAPEVKEVTIQSLKRVHFNTGSDRLDEEAMTVLGQNVSWLARNPGSVLVLEGHCDERGDAAYNLQLGDRRARSVKAQLIAKGVNSDRLIMVVSRGELRPIDSRHTRDAWRSNRRVEFIVR